MTTYLHVPTTPTIPFFGDPTWPPQNSSPLGDRRARTGDAQKIKVIVIDDEALIAETVVEILKEDGFDARAAATGHSAIELAREWAPDVVLSDVIMPGLNGIDAGIQIREVAPDCRIILFSGQAATVNLLEEARERGHRFDILAKPIKPEELISVIRSGFRS